MSARGRSEPLPKQERIVWIWYLTEHIKDWGITQSLALVILNQLTRSHLVALLSELTYSEDTEVSIVTCPVLQSRTDLVHMTVR